MKIGVVLIHWNSGDFTRDCIQSLLNAQMKPWRIMVWDNASTDGAIDEIKERYPDIWIIEHHENIGFADACNRASEQLIDAGAEAIWLLNNDTIVDKECLTELVCYLEKDPGTCMTTGKIYYMDNPKQIWYAGGRIEPFSLLLSFRKLDQIDTGGDHTPFPVSFASGCCMLIRAEIIRNFGLFTPAFIAYAEDYEFCLKLKFAQQKILYIPSAIMWHKVSASCKKNNMGARLGRISPAQHFIGSRNQIWALRGAVPNSMHRKCAICLYLLDRLCISFGLLLFWRWEKLKMLWKGLVVGLTQSPDDVNRNGMR